MKKKHPKDAESPIIDGPLSDHSDRQHGIPLKPDRTRVDISKKLGQCDFRQLSAKKESISSDSFNFSAIPQIRQNHYHSP